MNVQPGHYLDIGRMDELGRLDSPIHRLDARAKIITTGLFLLVVMSFGRYEVAALMPLFVYPIVFLAVGNIPVGLILRKVALALPFALFIGIFNPLLDREPALLIGSVPVSGGWLSFASIMVRFALTVSAALLLVACSGIHRLCAGIERLGLPQVFAVQLLFLYRYFFVIGDEGLRMKRSAELRSAGWGALPLRTYGTLIGHLLLRAMDRAERIYRAMVGRGFTGEVRVMRPTRFGWPEVAFVAGWTVFFVGVRWWNLADWLGRRLLGSGA